MSLYEITLLGFLAGTLGTGLGGGAAVFLSRISSRQLSTLLGFSAGIMLAIVFFDLIPEALHTGGIFWGVAGVILGTVLMACIDFLLPHFHVPGERAASRYVHTGVVLGLGIAMHNFPEGLAIGGGSTYEIQLGFALAAAIAFHDIPEGLAMAIPLCLGKVRRSRIVLGTVAAGMPTGLGALLGAIMGRVSPVFMSLALGLAGGAMLFITCDEMLPQAKELSRGRSAAFGTTAGVISGILLTALLAG